MNREEAGMAIDAALDGLAESLESGMSANLLAYLDTMAKFHRYSFSNQMLIWIQRDDATHVAGFHSWLKLGRYVKKGEKGIAILAPCTYKQKSECEEEEAKTILRGFRVVYVFDVAQTDGEPLASIGQLGGDPGELTDILRRHIRDSSITLEYVEELHGGANGESHGGLIRIRNGLSAAQEFSTLVHEMAHERLHHAGGDVPNSVKETEAEAVAYVVCRSVGLECSTRAQDYIQSWGGNPGLLQASLAAIRSVASEILDALAVEPEPAMA